MCPRPTVISGVIACALVCLGTCRAIGSEAGLSPADELWASARERHEAAARDEAIRLYEEFNEVTASYGITSPSGYTNLAILRWEKEEKSLALRMLLDEMARTSSPVRLFRRFGDIDAIEQSLGAENRTARAWEFRLPFLLNADVRFACAVMLFWCVAGAALIAKLARAGRGRTIGLSGTAVSAVALGSLLLAGGMYGPRRESFAVLHAGTGLVPIFQEPGIGDGAKLTDLVAGTLVFVQTPGEDYSRISLPVAGWVATGNLLTAGRSLPARSDSEPGGTPSDPG